MILTLLMTIIVLIMPEVIAVLQPPNALVQTL